MSYSISLQCAYFPNDRQQVYQIIVICGLSIILKQLPPNGVLVQAMAQHTKHHQPILHGCQSA